ncbi:uncharacterized protein J3R85_001485 [Psidium guajava]|nr:uncharacterized protein J3R85_001485 [Psidium guajava]
MLAQEIPSNGSLFPLLIGCEFQAETHLVSTQACAAPKMELNVPPLATPSRESRLIETGIEWPTKPNH